MERQTNHKIDLEKTNTKDAPGWKSITLPVTCPPAVRAMRYKKYKIVKLTNAKAEDSHMNKFCDFDRKLKEKRRKPKSEESTIYGVHKNN